MDPQRLDKAALVASDHPKYPLRATYGPFCRRERGLSLGVERSYLALGFWSAWLFRI